MHPVHRPIAVRPCLRLKIFRQVQRSRCRQLRWLRGTWSFLSWRSPSVTDARRMQPFGLDAAGCDRVHADIARTELGGSCRHGKSEGLRSLKIDYELKLGWLKHGKIGWLFTLEDCCEMSAVRRKVRRRENCLPPKCIHRQGICRCC